MFMKAKNVLIPLIVLTAIVVVVPVVAAESRFLQGAQDWFERRCNRERVSGSTAFDCYLFEQVQELLNRVGRLESQPSPNLKIFDANGTELGVMVDPGTFFYPVLGRLVPIEESQSKEIGLQILAYFSGTNCSGDVYLSSDSANLNRFVNHVLVNGTDTHFILERGTSESAITYRSKRYWAGQNDGWYCEDRNRSDTASLRALKSVSLLFSNPAPLPLEYRYE